MAKKRRAKRREEKRRRRPTAQARAERPAVAAAAPPRKKEGEAKAEPSPEKVAVSLAEQYPYVYSDLKRIAILAGTIFAILIILSLVIK